ncbi:MAG: hypothetical protein ABFS08_06080 [Pseudomonadota bacterium]
MRKRKPDLMVVLAVLIGLGVMVTEVTYGKAFSPEVNRTTVSR